MQKSFIVCFILTCLLDFGLRIAGVTFDSLYLDESYQTLLDAVGEPAPPLMELKGEPYRFSFGPPRSTAQVISNLRSVDALGPPLYFVILNRWISVFGSADFAVRSLSALLSFAALVALFLLTNWVFGPLIAVVAALLQAVSPFELMYGQEARMYCLEILVSCLSGGSLMVLLFKQPTRKHLFALLPTYAISTWALLNTHYTGVFFVLFEGVFAVAWCFIRKNYRLLGLLACAWIATLLMWVPWFDLFRQASAVRNDQGSFYVTRKPSWSWPFYGLLRLVIDWVCLLCGNRVTAFAAPIYGTAVLFMVAGFKTAFDALKGKGDAQPAEPAGKAPVVFILGWILFPSLAMWFMDVIESRRVIDMARYLIFVAPAVYTLCAMGVVKFAAQRGKLVATLLLIHTVFAIVNITNYHIVHQRRPWREMAVKVEEVMAPDDVLMVSHYFNIVCLDRYLTRDLRQVGLSPQLGAENISKKIESVTPRLSRFWLLTAEDGENIRDIMPSNFRMAQKIDLPHELHLRLYQRI